MSLVGLIFLWELSGALVMGVFTLDFPPLLAQNQWLYVNFSGWVFLDHAGSLKLYPRSRSLGFKFFRDLLSFLLEVKQRSICHLSWGEDAFQPIFSVIAALHGAARIPPWAGPLGFASGPSVLVDI